MANWNIKDDLMNGDRLLFYLVSGSTTGQTVEQAITMNNYNYENILYEEV